MGSLPDYTSAMERFKESDEARQKLLADIVKKYESLATEHSALRDDYESERQIRRSYQQELARKDLQLNRVENSSFILGLIDGDGVIFQDAMLQAGADGGSEAATKLQRAIREHISSLYNNAGNWPTLVHIYLSLDKLGQALCKAGLLKHPQELRSFAQSFNVNQPLFSIVDVGHGKERADYKIKEMLRTFSNNPSCKHIIFGGCHDAGYLNDLGQYKHDAEKASHVTLLESTPAHRGFVDLPNFDRTRFDEVFRTEPLRDPVQSPMPPPSSLLTRQPTRSTSPQAVRPSIPAESPATSPTPATTQESQCQSPAASWASVGKSGASKGEISLGRKSPSKKRYIYYNKDGYRLDEPLPPKDYKATEAIDNRVRKAGRVNLCNQYHLNKGKCDNGKFCNFQHEPKLTPAERNALHYKARGLPCKDRQCENFDCYFGHQCAYERDRGYCDYGETCNLRFSHGMDKVKYERWDEDGNVVTQGV